MHLVSHLRAQRFNQAQLPPVLEKITTVLLQSAYCIVCFLLLGGLFFLEEVSRKHRPTGKIQPQIKMSLHFSLVISKQDNKELDGHSDKLNPVITVKLNFHCVVV